VVNTEEKQMNETETFEIEQTSFNNLLELRRSEVDFLVESTKYSEPFYDGSED
jgi:hypothetical protein